MTQSGSVMELPEAEIRRHYAGAQALLDGFDHAPRRTRGAPVGARGGLPGHRAFRSTTPGLAATRPLRGEGVRLLERILEAGEDPLPSPARAGLARALRRALAIAMAVGAEWGEAVGLDSLKRSNREGAVPAGRAAGFARLLSAEALIQLHVTGNALAFLLAPLVEEGAVAGEDPQEILTENAPLALQGMLWDLDRRLEGAEAPVAVAAGFAEGLMAEVERRVGGAEGGAADLSGFAARSWRVEADGLIIHGLVRATAGHGPALQMEFARPEEVIGNHQAKAQAMRLARMLMAHDFKRGRNPFVELGGFAFTFLGDGRPGTGKTTLIRMMAGLLQDYCGVAGYAFRYRNLSVDAVDSYQGKSGQNARAFIEAVSDPSVIGLGTIDDIDQVAGRRGDPQASTGQQEITAVLMDAFAGAGTVVRGNCAFGMFSNHPDRVDDALRQRAGARFSVDGPQEQGDYIDLLALMLGQGHAIPVGDHALYQGQQLRPDLASGRLASGNLVQEAPVDARLAGVLQAVGQPETLTDLGRYLHEIARMDPRFTGRAVKNIADAVRARAMDVTMPDEWLEDPAIFLRRDYDTKLAMLSELRQPITAGMVLEEINRYAGAELRYAETSDEAAIERMVQEMTLSQQARKRFREGQ